MKQKVKLLLSFILRVVISTTDFKTKLEFLYISYFALQTSMVLLIPYHTGQGPIHSASRTGSSERGAIVPRRVRVRGSGMDRWDLIRTGGRRDLM